MIGRPDLQSPDLASLAMLDDQGFRAMFSASPIKRIGRDLFVRNVVTAIGNSGDQQLRPVAEALRGDHDAVVAEAAEWACECLDKTSHRSSISRKACA